MNIQRFLENMAERVSGNASAKLVYGEPVVAGDHTVIPAATVRYAFGAGGGGGKDDKDEEEARRGGGGGGGIRLAAWPCGALEITPAGSRFVEFGDTRKTAVALALGMVLGAALATLVSRGRE